MKRYFVLAAGILALSTPSVALASEGGTSLTTLAIGIGAGWLISLALSVVRPQLGIAVAGLMGLGVSLYLGVQHGKTDLFCDVNEAISCSAVLQSQYATLLNIPIAFFGSGFYAAAIAGGVMALLQPEQYRAAQRLLLGGAGLSVLYSLFLAWASKQVGSLCPFCVSLYGVNAILLFACYWWGRSGIEAATEDDRSSPVMMGTGTVVFVAAVLFGGSGSGGVDAADAASLSPQQLAGLFEAPAGTVTLDGTEPLLGDENAPYVVVEFADFQCPYCGMVAPQLKTIVGDNPDIQLRYKHYPISNLCNENVDRAGHEDACGAAMASECALQQQRFWDLNRLLFKNQNNLTDGDLRFMAQQVGLDMDAFQTCMDNPLTETAVRTDVAHATQAGITGTPTLFLRGVQGDEWVRVQGGPDELMTLIAAHRAGVSFPSTPPASGH